MLFFTSDQFFQPYNPAVVVPSEPVVFIMISVYGSFTPSSPVYIQTRSVILHGGGGGVFMDFW